MPEGVIHFSFDPAENLSERPFAVVRLPTLCQLIHSGKPFVEKIARVKVRWIVFGQWDKARAHRCADGDNFGEKSNEHSAVEIAHAACRQRSVGEGAKVAQASISQLAPEHARYIV